ncbi:MAG TPA: thioredoxin domain-containing protein [Pyrinomonadaceae bacterium]|nr:thioredoxin domain-containing protein [Pyrinomonadaceae bacterium]
MKNIAIYTKLFIVIGLLAFIIGCDGKSNTAGNNTTVKNTANTATNPTNAPIGATPPNMLGSPNAAVTVEEFADFQCPTCAQVHGVMKNVQAAYGSRIKFIYRNYPLVQIHKNSYDAAVAAESAGMQGKFWDMQNMLFSNQQAWSNASDARTIFEGYAEKIGLEIEKYKTDVNGLGAKSRVDADLQRGRALNVNSTPTIYINGKSVPFEQMNIDALKGLIDAELQKAGPVQTAPANSAPSSTANATAKPVETNTKPANK